MDIFKVFHEISNSEKTFSSFANAKFLTNNKMLEIGFFINLEQNTIGRDTIK
jgi:hypothetical protein